MNVGVLASHVVPQCAPPSPRPHAVLGLASISRTGSSESIMRLAHDALSTGTIPATATGATTLLPRGVTAASACISGGVMSGWLILTTRN